MKGRLTLWFVVPIVSALATALAASPASRPATNPTTRPVARSEKPGNSVDYWLNQATTEPEPGEGAAAKPPTTQPAPSSPSASQPQPSREDALPGVLELSDGKLLPGWVCTTKEKNFEVWVQEEKQFRRVPPIIVRSITATVLEEKTELRWRWKESGSDERVWTGEEYPIRRLRYELHLIDGTTITGSIKGQPLWVECGDRKIGPFLLQEKSTGDPGQKLADMVYVRKVYISRRLMEQVVKEQVKDH